jgi:hypothetical protein
MIVLLDTESHIPRAYSTPFYFGENPGIEFCIGFAIYSNHYIFWLSRHDKSPIQYIIPMQSILPTHLISS